MKLVLLLITAASLLLPKEAFGASSDWIDIAGGRARLVVAEPLPGVSTTDAALEVDLNPGWKTYWRDPGDAGIPLQVDFSKSANARLVDVLYPAPKRFDDGVSVWSGYDFPIAFGIKLERPDIAKPVSLNGTVFLGVCEKICVPVQLEFNVEAQDSAKPTIQSEVVALRMVQLPMHPSAGMQVTQASVAGKSLTVEVEVYDNGVPPVLFLAGNQGLQFKAPVLKSAGAGKAVFEAGILFWKPDKPGAPSPVHYTLVSGEESVSGLFEIPAP
jgi:DsbC/DsbD-like thiol-disulfide interchange protein